MTLDETCERRGGCAGAEDRQELHAHERRERVVEHAVGDEAVAAAVPVVVPDAEAVQHEEAALIEMCGKVGAGRPEPDEQRRSAGADERVPAGRRKRAQGAA
jgi:hypothetical protein